MGKWHKMKQHIEDMAEKIALELRNKPMASLFLSGQLKAYQDMRVFTNELDRCYATSEKKGKKNKRK